MEYSCCMYAIVSSCLASVQGVQKNGVDTGVVLPFLLVCYYLW
jgi:hypothetical protein